MSTMKTSVGKSRSRYKESNRRDANKTSDGLKLLKGVEKRKVWRIAKFKNTPQAQLSSTTRRLFRKWEIDLLGPKKSPVEVKPTIHKRWGRLSK